VPRHVNGETVLGLGAAEFATRNGLPGSLIHWLRSP